MYEVSDSLLELPFWFLCFRYVFFDIWWMIYVTVAGNSLLLLPDREPLLMMQICDRSSCPCGFTEACQFISFQLSAPLLYVFWCEVHPLWPCYKFLPACLLVTSLHSQKTLHSSLHVCILLNQVQGLFLSITQFLFPLKYITSFAWFQWHPVFHASGIVHPLPCSFLRQHFDYCGNHENRNTVFSAQSRADLL